MDFLKLSGRQRQGVLLVLVQIIYTYLGYIVGYDRVHGCAAKIGYTVCDSPFFHSQTNNLVQP